MLSQHSDHQRINVSGQQVDVCEVKTIIQQVEPLLGTSWEFRPRIGDLESCYCMLLIAIAAFVVDFKI